MTILRKLTLALMAGAIMIGPTLAAECSTPSAQTACSTADIRIKQANMVDDSSSGMFAMVVGELTNGCDVAPAPEIHIVLRDSAGMVLATEDMWPSESHNIAAHSDYAFSSPVRSYAGKWVTE